MLQGRGKGGYRSLRVEEMADAKGSRWMRW